MTQIKQLIALLALSSLTACAYQNPTAPTPTAVTATPPVVQPTPPPATPPSLRVALAVGPASPIVGERTAFTAIVMEGAASSYLWDYGDGATALGTDTVTFHVYTTGGNYRAQVTATGAGATASSYQFVDVT